MPGVVKQWSEAYGKVEHAAESDGQHWDVRNALDENLQITKQHSLDRFPTFEKQLDHAVKMTLGEIRDNTVMREESESIDRSDPQIREWNSRIMNEGNGRDLTMPGPVAQYLQGQDSDHREEQEHRSELASDRDAEQWQRDQLSRLSTPELHDRWVSTVREFWAESETLDFHNGSPIAADRAAELEAQTKLIYTEMNKPERAAELHELEQAPPWIEQSVEHYSSLSTPDLHALWQETSSEFLAAMDVPDYRQGSPFAAHHVEELQAHANLIRAELDTPERAAESYALDHHGHQIEQGLSY